MAPGFFPANPDLTAAGGPEGVPRRARHPDTPGAPPRGQAEAGEGRREARRGYGRRQLRLARAISPRTPAAAPPPPQRNSTAFGRASRARLSPARRPRMFSAGATSAGRKGTSCAATRAPRRSTSTARAFPPAPRALPLVLLPSITPAPSPRRVARLLHKSRLTRAVIYPARPAPALACRSGLVAEPEGTKWKCPACLSEDPNYDWCGRMGQHASRSAPPSPLRTSAPVPPRRHAPAPGPPSAALRRAQVRRVQRRGRPHLLRLLPEGLPQGPPRPAASSLSSLRLPRAREAAAALTRARRPRAPPSRVRQECLDMDVNPDEEKWKCPHCTAVEKARSLPPR